MKKVLISFLLVIITAFSVYAAPIVSHKDHALWVKSATTAEVEDIFYQHNYPDYSQVESKFPRIFLSRLPSDWEQIEDNDEKHKLFIRIMLPLVLKVNEDILQERKIVENMYIERKDGKNLGMNAVQKLEELAKKYDVATPETDIERIDYLLYRLMEKIDAVPPTVMVVTAGIYSDWGNSRIARQANNLYLSEIWYENKGMKPLDDPNADYRYKIYADLYEAIAERALKINSHVNYEYVRRTRLNQRKLGLPPYSPHMAAQMIKDSNFQNIAGLIDYTLSFYGLWNTDYKPQLRDIK